ncbi:unnamed protein product [Adineta ricciae]|uniref:SWIM-type domain-containing protein n=1 Tax=Adineta ricciae TaxID=249248 RepID=A0A816CJB8_ADIRI|nr:unnamed protein product [Adineta ricciae]CAF1623461.1 unnamed protein product [Adineta ricciae]
MELTQVEQYESDLSEEELFEGQETSEPTRKQRKKISKVWIKKVVFDTSTEAEVSIGNQWSKYYTNYTEEGRKVYYRCKKAKRHGPQCTAGTYLLYHADSDKVTIYETETEHQHHQDEVRGIDESVRKVIEDLFNDGIKKPKLILRALESRKVKVPTSIQLNNYLVYYRKKKYGSHKISLGELEEWCKNNETVPVDENQSFVVFYKILYNNDEYEDDEDIEDDTCDKFRFFISSLRLLNIASTSQHIHADATYKLVWQGFPVLIVGTTDLNKVFHPFGMAVCSNEKTKDFQFIFNSLQVGMQKIGKDLLKPTALISDAADAIKNGFNNVFGESHNEIMCWAHMKRKVENRICHIDNKEVRKDILEDIEMLQLCNSTTTFKLATTLFMKKWKINSKQKNQSILEFLDYFDYEWIKLNDGWYEGIQLNTPSTNNALESTNRTIKDDGTFRERHVLSRFLTISADIIYNWSTERDPSSVNVKVFAMEPTISLQLWTSSYQWAQSKKEVTCLSHGSTKKYYIPARDIQSITRSDINKYNKKQWTTFNQFKKSYDMWCMELENDTHWKTSKCNCPYFLKNYICKHVVGMAIRLKYCKPPASAKTVPIGQKRKRGRPAKAKAALLMQ